MDHSEYRSRLMLKALTPEEVRQIWHEIDKLMKEGQHLKATMLYNTFFPDVAR